MLTNPPPPLPSSSDDWLSDDSRAFGVASCVVYGMSVVFALLLRAQFGDDCFYPNHPAWEARLHRINFAVVLLGLVIAFIGCFRDRPKGLSIGAAASALPLLIFEGAMQGCE